MVYSDESQMFNACRFGFKFEGLVANTEDLVIFARERAERGTKSEGLSSAALPSNLISVDDVSFIIVYLLLLLCHKLSGVQGWSMLHLNFGVLQLVPCSLSI